MQPKCKKLKYHTHSISKLPSILEKFPNVQELVLRIQDFSGMQIDLFGLKSLKSFKLALPNIRELENVKDFKLLLPDNQVDLYLKMTKAEGPLENFLRNIKKFPFVNIDGEFREIECDKQLTEIILYRNMNLNLKAKPIDNF